MVICRKIFTIKFQRWFEQSLRSEEMPLFTLIEQIGEVYSNYRLILRVKSERIDCNRQRETYLQRKKTNEK